MVHIILNGLEVTPTSHVVLIAYDGTSEERSVAEEFIEIIKESTGRVFYIVPDLRWNQNLAFHQADIEESSSTQARIPIVVIHFCHS